MKSQPASLLKEARDLTGLSQRGLAVRAGTSQSVVARIEAGATSPTWDTVERLLAALGLELRAELIARLGSSTHMLDDVARILQLSPEQRLLELRNASRFVNSARRVS